MSKGKSRQVPGDIVVAYLEKFPKTSTRALARMIFEENKPVWTSYDACRSCIRDYRGAHGDAKRGDMATKKHYQTAKEREPVLPSSDAKDYKPYYLPNGRGLVMADMHIPYHRPEAIKAAVDWAVEHKYTDWLLLNGDIQDCYSLSTWVKDPRARDFASERDMVIEVLDYLDKRLKSPKIHFKAGNHESRFEKYLAVKAPELFGCEEFRYSSLLKFKERGIVHIEAVQLIYCGYLTILHGHEWGGTFFSPVNPARGAFLRGHDCILVAHQHRSSHHEESTIRGRQMSCWSIGALCDLHPDYRPLNKWGWGFACIEKDGQNFHIENKRILHDGEVV